MRVDICAYDSPSAVTGPASWFQRVPVRLIEAGVKLKVHLFWWDSELEGTLRKYVEEKGIPFTSHKFLSTKENVSRLLQAVARDPPAVFVADNVIPGLFATRYLKDWGIRTVGIIRSDDAFYHGVIDRFVGGHPRDQLDAVVSVSQYLTECANREGLGRVRCETVPSGAPMPSTRGHPRNDRIRIVYSGRLIQEQKRIIETARCLVELCVRFPSIDALIAGDGPERRLVEEIVGPSNGRVQVLGRLTDEQLQSVLAESHIILLLSDYEGNPTAVMEAMANGMVPICMRIRSGIPELVIDGTTGLLVTDRWDSVFSAVGKLVDCQSLLHELSSNAREHVNTHFSVDASVKKWVRLLEEIVLDGTRLRATFVPSRLSFPSVHPAFAHQDSREVEGLDRLMIVVRRSLSRCRIFAGRWRRLIINAFAGRHRPDRRSKNDP